MYRVLKYHILIYREPSVSRFRSLTNRSSKQSTYMETSDMNIPTLEGLPAFVAGLSKKWI